MFSNAELFEAELEAVFTRAWLFIGHESQVPDPGDFFVSRMGTESVILSRDKDRQLHVFLNSCRHRGMKVCLYDEGNTNVFTCPYHAWKYTGDGKLSGVPQRAQLYPDLRRDPDLEKAQHIWASFPGGHGVHSAIKPAGGYQSSYQDDPIVDGYFRDCFERRQKLLGAEQARLVPFVGTMFPNTSFHGGQPRALCVWHPHGPQHNEIWRFFLVDADAPAEVKNLLRRYYMRYSGPAGMTEQDDMENWNYATKASSGPIAQRYAFNYQQSMGAATDDGPVPGRVSTQITEENARCYYRSWAAYMEGRSWDEIMASGAGGMNLGNTGHGDITAAD